MTTEITPPVQEEKKMKMNYQGGSSDTVYGLGLIGAWVYYFGRAKSFQEGVAGFFKGIVWPAILVYEAFKLLEKMKGEGEGE
jgi:hypothetical protein